MSALAWTVYNSRVCFFCLAFELWRLDCNIGCQETSNHRKRKNTKLTLNVLLNWRQNIILTSIRNFSQWKVLISSAQLSYFGRKSTNKVARILSHQQQILEQYLNHFGYYLHRIKALVLYQRNPWVSIIWHLKLFEEILSCQKGSLLIPRKAFL